MTEATAGRCGTGAVALLLAALLLAACGDDSSAADEQPTIVATTSIWADVVANIVCDTMPVETIITVGADPHAFAPSLADRGRMESAALVVANGVDLEEGIADTLDAVESSGTPVLRVGDEIDTITVSDGTDEDPHVWFDPVRVAAALPVLASAIASGAGIEESTLEPCVSAYIEELTTLDAEIADRLRTIPADRRLLVTNHDALGYFADRYDFEVLGTVIPGSSTLVETNPAALAALGEAIETTGVGVIFADAAESTDDADALARSIGGVEVIELHTGSLGEAGTAADSYVGLLRTNAELVAGGIDGR